MYYNGRHGCLKCEVVGRYSHISRTMTFTDINCRRRTNEDFRMKKCEFHHHNETPLTDLPIDMIETIPVGDELHLLNVGIMKKLLIGWLEGSFGYSAKFSHSNRNEISEYLINCKLPSEIHRKMRSLSEIKRWKATEFRAFLLYVSVVVLKRFLRPKYYEHFLLFYCSIAIFSSEYHLERLFSVSESMMLSYLNIFKQLYGVEYFSSNVHNLSHLAEEVKRFGILKNFNTYKFENKLQSIKKMVRSGNLPLNQAAKRVFESEIVQMPIKKQMSGNEFLVSSPTTLQCTGVKNLDLHDIAYNKIQFSEFCLSHLEQDKWFLTTTFEIVALKRIVKVKNSADYLLYGTAVNEKQIFFKCPFTSHALFIYACKNVFRKAEIFRTENIACKLVCLPYSGSYNDTDEEEESPVYDHIFVPLWHTLKK